MTSTDAGDALSQTSTVRGWIRDEEDWSGISDTKERRKIQNRRNQRIHRMMQGPIWSYFE